MTDHAGPSVPEGDDEALPDHYWDEPALYGEAEAVASVGTVAAPLLAGFCLTATVQALTLTTSDTRWPSLMLLLFMLASLLFVATVQFMFWARRYQVGPSELKVWWPDADHPQRTKMLQDIQKRHAVGFRRWARWARAAYRAALLFLLAGFTILAVPPAGSHGQPSVIRWVAVGVGAAAFVAEVIWSARAPLSDSRR